MQLSIVIPLYREAETIRPLFQALNKLKKEVPNRTEIILVDDGSDDATLKKVKKLKLKYPKRIISLSKNFGHQAALLAGMHAARGKLVVTMDGDLQHPPTLIPQMLQLAKSGYDIVLTQKIDRDVTSGFKKLSSQWFYRFVNMFSDTAIISSASDFRLLNRRALDAVLSLPEHRTFLRGLVNWIGFTKVIIPFEVQHRVGGESKYTLLKMFKLALSGITSFSTLPLYLAGVAGGCLSLLSAFYAVYIVIQFLRGQTVSGWASMLLVLLIIGSFLFIFLGVIGVYLAGIYDEVKRRPLYIIKEDTYEK